MHMTGKALSLHPLLERRKIYNASLSKVSFYIAKSHQQLTWTLAQTQRSGQEAIREPFNS